MDLLESPLVKKYFGCGNATGWQCKPNGCDCTENTALRVLKAMLEFIKYGDRYLSVSFDGGGIPVVVEKVSCGELHGFGTSIRLPSRFQPAEKKEVEVFEAWTPCVCCGEKLHHLCGQKKPTPEPGVCWHGVLFSSDCGQCGRRVPEPPQKACCDRHADYPDDKDGCAWLNPENKPPLPGEVEEHIQSHKKYSEEMGFRSHMILITETDLRELCELARRG